MSEHILISNISKRYPQSGVQALQDISLEILPGEIFGLIGPDGAGKSTLFRILATLILPDAGNASVFGFDIVKDFREIRKIVGYMPGRFSLYQDLSVEENIRFFATVFNTTVEENYHLIRDIYSQLEPFKDRRAGKLSGGMKQKLALCCALVHQPRVLLLDEPTTGVDPVSRKEFWDILDVFKQKGIVILVSTPYMDEAARCDRIALIQKGHILDIDTYEGMLKKHEYPILVVQAVNMYELLLDLRAYKNCASSYSFGSVHHVTLNETSDDSIDALREYLVGCGHHGLKIEKIHADIEDIFIDLMTRAA
jgi:ABC-type multidrug transport system ATPase subunit